MTCRRVAAHLADVQDRLLDTTGDQRLGEGLQGPSATDAGRRGGGFADEQPDDGWSVHRVDDPQYVADMQRIEAMRELGFADAMCLSCGAALFVPENERCGDVLCQECQRTGEALAAEEDGEPSAPAGRFSGLAQYSVADLIDAIARVDNSLFSHSEWVGVDATGNAPDEAPPSIPGYLLRTPEDKAAFLDAATAILLRRMDAGARQAA